MGTFFFLYFSLKLQIVRIITWDQWLNKQVSPAAEVNDGWAAFAGWSCSDRVGQLGTSSVSAWGSAPRRTESPAARTFESVAMYVQVLALCSALSLFFHFSLLGFLEFRWIWILNAVKWCEWGFRERKGYACWEWVIIFFFDSLIGFCFFSLLFFGNFKARTRRSMVERIIFQVKFCLWKRDIQVARPSVLPK